jgi:hypothetical protein
MVVFESSYHDFSLSIPQAKAELIEADTQGVEYNNRQGLCPNVTGRTAKRDRVAVPQSVVRGTGRSRDRTAKGDVWPRRGRDAETSSLIAVCLCCTYAGRKQVEKE